MSNEKQDVSLLKKSKAVKEIPYAQIQVGDTETFTRKVTNQDVLDFASLTEDVNPIHIDDDFAKGTRFKERIAHGMLTASYISTLLGTILPGKNALYLSQNCKFVAPVRIGDTIKVVGEVINKRDDKKIITVQTNIYNQKDQLVVEGTAVVMKNEQR